MIDGTVADTDTIRLRFAKEGVERVLAHVRSCTEHAPPPNLKPGGADVKLGQTVTAEEMQQGIPFSKLDLTRFPAGVLLAQDNSGVFLLSNGLPETNPITRMAVYADGYGPADDWMPVWEDELFEAWLPADTVADALTTSGDWLTITVRGDQITL